MPRIRSADSETNKYLNSLRRKGYLVKGSKSGHWKIYLKREGHDPAYVTSTSSSPSVFMLDRLKAQVVRKTEEILNGKI